NTLTGAQRLARTDSAGGFHLAGLPAGPYTVSAHKEKFAPSQHALTLVGGSTADLALQLNVAGAETDITVTGALGSIRTDEPQLGDRLGSEMMEMPLLNSRISYLPLLNAANRPAINQGDIFMNQNLFTTNGSGRRQTSWVVDGSSGNDSWGRQTIFSNVPEIAMQEMTVLENAFSSEYGATTGGVVNIITRTGGNKFHGDLIGLWRPSDTVAKLSGFTQASSKSGNEIVDDTLGQFSASVSGPLFDPARTHFFFAGEYSRQNRTSSVTAPIAPSLFVGHYAGWMTFLRVDHQINGSNDLFFRANTDSFHDTNPNAPVGGNNLPTVDRLFRLRPSSAEISETAVLSNSLLNTARAQFQLGSPITQFDPVVFGTQIVVPITG